MTCHVADSAPGSVQLIDMIFPGDANHHGTLFGGVALAHMDKVAFLAASRHARAPFVTAASDKIDFAAPARIGEMIEATGRVVRVGASSLDVEVESAVHARALILVARKGPSTLLPLPPLTAGQAVPSDPVDMVFPSQSNHYGTLYGGDALKMMGKAAFIAATRHARGVMVMAASDRIDFTAPIREGEMVALASHVVTTGRTSVQIGVELSAENLLTGDRLTEVACDAASVFGYSHRMSKQMSRTQVIAKATKVFGSRTAAERWLADPAIGLDQMRPIDLLSTRAGMQLVDTYLEQIEHGVYV